jgi:hypothetical protein
LFAVDAVNSADVETKRFSKVSEVFSEVLPEDQNGSADIADKHDAPVRPSDVREAV